MKLLIILVTILGFALPSFADRVNKRQMRQNARVFKGVQKDQFTRGEAKRLRKSGMRIRRVERRAKQDGVVTKREKRRLENMQDRRSQQIKRLRHNDREPSQQNEQ